MTPTEENAILVESLSKMIDIVYAMSVNDDGQMSEEWKKHQAEVLKAKSLADKYVKKEDNYYEETSDLKDEEVPDMIPGTDVMYRPYREPLVDNSAVENHETAGQDSDGQTTISKDSYPSTEVS